MQAKGQPVAGCVHRIHDRIQLPRLPRRDMKHGAKDLARHVGDGIDPDHGWRNEGAVCRGRPFLEHAPLGPRGLDIGADIGLGFRVDHGAYIR